MMPKHDTINAILKLNRSAQPDFLAAFSNEELQKYLGRLSLIEPWMSASSQMAGSAAVGVPSCGTPRREKPRIAISFQSQDPASGSSAQRDMRTG